MPKRIKVVHLITLLENGGAQGNTLYTAENLDDSRFDVSLWFGKGGYWDGWVEKNQKLKARCWKVPFLVRPLNPIFDFLAFIALVFKLRRVNPDIIHTHSSKAGILGRTAAALAGVPKIVHTVHGFGFNTTQSKLIYQIYVGLERWTARATDALIFVSQSNRDEAVKLNIGRPTTHRLIRSGIPIKNFHDRSSEKREIEQRLGISLKGRIISTIGAFKPQKNLLEFIDSIEPVLNAVPETSVLIIGDGEMREAIAAKIRSLHRDQHIHVLGWRNDVADLLSITDVFVMTSLWEGLPRALLEAMAAGVPAVCYDTDGVRDVLSKGGGIIVKQRDISATTDAVIKLLTDRAKWKELSETARQLITEEFDIDHMVRQQESLYLELVSRQVPLPGSV